MLKALFRWRASRSLSPYNKKVSLIKEYASKVALMSSAELTQSKERLSALKRSGAKVDELKLEAFAIVAEVAKRSLRKEPYDCQLLGAVAMSEGNLIQMGTGEGKTLVAPFVAYWQAILGKQTHICTVNEFLAKRDAVELSPLYRALGLTVSACLVGQELTERRQVYSHDVVYGTHGEFASDYLRDNTQQIRSQVVQVRGRGFVIIDEADSVMIDDARMPISLFIPIANTAEQSQIIADYVVPHLEVCDEPRQRSIIEKKMLDAIAKEVAASGEGFELKDSELESGDFFVDPVRKAAMLTDRGYTRVTELLVKHGALKESDADFGSEHQSLLQKVGMALAAQHLLHKGLNYVVQDSQLIPIDELTGRLNHGRTWGATLTQALEAKEGLVVSPDRITAASIPLQSYFKLYDGMAGMSGTLMSEAEEFKSVYGLNIVRVPPNKPMVREDKPDLIFKDQQEKLNAVVADITRIAATKQPILVGTVSITQSEELSARLKEVGLAHEVLNASNHSQEAEILANAGKAGAITVTTNMAGRGVDIILGGNPDAEMLSQQIELGVEAWDAMSAEEQRAMYEGVLAETQRQGEVVRMLGGLHIIGMERYDTRRKDQQLRGRAGRQGDPGSSQFYIALDDPLVRDFGGDRIKQILAQLDLKNDPELEHAMLSKAIDNAQKSAETAESEARQSLIELDEVGSDQREAYYTFRESVFNPEQANEQFNNLLGAYIKGLLEKCHITEDTFPEQWDVIKLNAFLGEVQIELWDSNKDAKAEQEQLREGDWEAIALLLKEKVLAKYEETGKQASNEEELLAMRQYVALEVLDASWFRMQLNMEELRKGIHLRGHARLNPEHELRRGAGELFEEMLEEAMEDMAKALLVWVKE